MQLIFTSLDPNYRLREYSWWFTNLETICDVLNSVVAKGSQLIRAELVDQGHCTQLPVNAFDGNACSGEIKQLEQEWQQALSVPASLSCDTNQHLIGVAQQQARTHESRIAQLEQAIKLLELQRQQFQDSIFGEPGRSILMNINELAIQEHLQHLAITQASKQTIVNQLRLLNDSKEE